MFRLFGADVQLKEKREDLIEDLSKKCHALNLQAILFFDAQYTLEESQRHHKLSFEIRYTDYQQIADDSIIQELKVVRSPKEYTVVTSDKNLALRARRLDAETMSVEDFFELIGRRFKNLKTPNKKKSNEPIPRKLSDPSSLPRDQFSVYLEHFEKELGETTEENPKKEKPLTETERWRRIFEERLEKEMDNNSDLE